MYATSVCIHVGMLHACMIHACNLNVQTTGMSQACSIHVAGCHACKSNFEQTACLGHAIFMQTIMNRIRKLCESNSCHNYQLYVCCAGHS